MQSVKKFNIKEHINLYYINDNKYKTVSMSMYLHRKLDKEEVTKNAVLAKVLKRGTDKYNTIKSLNTHLEELYGTLYSIDITKKANVQSICCTVSNISEKFSSPELSCKAAGLMMEFLFEPYAPNGVFDKGYVEVEKQNLKDDIDAIINDKRSFANLRVVEHMCSGEDNAILECGYVDDIPKINNENLFNHYKSIVNTSPIDIFVVGNVDIGGIVEYIKNYLDTISFDIKPIEIKGSLKKAGEPKYVDEVMNVNQGKLAMGFRTEIDGNNPLYYALLVGNSIYGAGAHSKLFNNVREKMSLAYYASSRLDRFNGLMIVSSGIEFSNYEKARDEIMVQLDAVKCGDFTQEDIKVAKNYIINSYKSYLDSSYLMKDFYLAMSFSGTHDTLEDAIKKVETVTKEDVVSAFSSVNLDTVYFLKGEEA